MEILILIRDHFCITNKKEIFFIWGLPAIFSVFFYFLFLSDALKLKDFKDFINANLAYLAIFVGFAITCITILLTSNSNNINEIRNKKIERKIRGIEISLYQKIYINFIFLIFFEILTLFFSLLFSLIVSKSGEMCFDIFSKVYLSFIIYCLMVTLLLNIRNIVSFYHIFFTKKV